MKLILIMAMTADGKIARDTNHFPDWTGKADKQMFKMMTMDAGVIIMGSKTFDTIGKPLPDRLNVVMTRHPERYKPCPNLMVTTAGPAALLAELSGQGYLKAVLAGGATINSLFARDKLIDEIVLTITPALFGQGLSMFSESLSADLDLLHHCELEPGILKLHYRIGWPEQQRSDL